MVSHYREGPIILAILVVIGTKYACNLSQDEDHTNFLNSFLSQDDPLQGVFKFSRLQAYMVSIETDIAGIFDPYLDRYCRHNRSPHISDISFKQVLHNMRTYCILLLGTIFGAEKFH